MQASWLVHLEKLAALKLCEAEKATLREDLMRIIGFTSKLPECSQENALASDSCNTYTELEEKDSITSFSLDSFAAGAPEFEDGFLQCPPVLQDKSSSDNE